MVLLFVDLSVYVYATDTLQSRRDGAKLKWWRKLATLPVKAASH